MAVIAPSRPVETMQRIADGKSLAGALHPWRRRLWMQQVVRWTGRGLFVGLVLACLVLLISRFVPWATASYWAGALARPLCSVRWRLPCGIALPLLALPGRWMQGWRYMIA